MEDAIGVTAACRVLGKSRSTLHRQRNPKPAAGPGARKEFHHPAELSAAEKERVLEALDSPRLADKAVAQAYTILLDEGRYLCSQATMHRLLRERGQSGERRAHAVHPAEETRIVGYRAESDMVVGYHEAEGPGPRGLVPALRNHGHILEEGNSLGDLADRDRNPGEGVHRARHCRE